MSLYPPRFRKERSKEKEFARAVEDLKDAVWRLEHLLRQLEVDLWLQRECSSS